MSRCIAARSLGIAATMTRSAAPFSNSAAASWLIPCREVRSLIPISTLPVADRHDVAALEGGQAPVLRRVAPPDVDLAGEVRVELVDRRGEDRLLVPGRPVERVERHAAVDPAGGVAGVERVGQRRQQVLGDARGVAHQADHVAAVRLGELVRRQPADQRLGQLAVAAARRGSCGPRRRGRGPPGWARPGGRGSSPSPRGPRPSRPAGCASRRRRCRGRASW